MRANPHPPQQRRGGTQRTRERGFPAPRDCAPDPPTYDHNHPRLANKWSEREDRIDGPLRSRISRIPNKPDQKRREDKVNSHAVYGYKHSRNKQECRSSQRMKTRGLGISRQPPCTEAGEDQLKEHITE